MGFPFSIFLKRANSEWQVVIYFISLFIIFRKVDTREAFALFESVPKVNILFSLIINIYYYVAKANRKIFRLRKTVELLKLFVVMESRVGIVNAVKIS